MNKTADAAPPIKADTDTEITLGLLSAVDTSASHSQRSLAAELGIALGLTNAYVRRCIRKGWIKVSDAPANRYAYYLTPKGFTEKSRLTAQYLSNSLRFYRRARDEMDQLFAEAAERGWRRIALVGRSDLTEIAILCSLRQSVEIAGVIDGAANDKRFLHVPVLRALADAGPIDGVVLTEMTAPQAAYDMLRATHAGLAVVAPRLLKITTGNR